MRAARLCSRVIARGSEKEREKSSDLQKKANPAAAGESSMKAFLQKALTMTSACVPSVLQRAHSNVCAHTSGDDDVRDRGNNARADLCQGRNGFGPGASWGLFGAAVGGRNAC